MTESDPNNQLIVMGELIEIEAQNIFERCGAFSDFCVQHVGSLAAIFGGVNRVIFSPRTGWRVDRSYCSSRFLEAWDSIKHEYATLQVQP